MCAPLWYVTPANTSTSACSSPSTGTSSQHGHRSWWWIWYESQHAGLVLLLALTLCITNRVRVELRGRGGGGVHSRSRWQSWVRGIIGPTVFLTFVLGLRLSPALSRLVIPLQRLQPSRLCSLGCLQRDSRAVWIHWALQATQHRARDEAKVLHPRLHPRGRRD